MVIVDPLVPIADNPSLLFMALRLPTIICKLYLFISIAGVIY